MTIPMILLGLIISTLFAAVFHLVVGGGATHLFAYIILSAIGFWIGNFIGVYFELSFFPIGALHLGFATIGSGVFLLTGRWLSKVEQQ